MDKRALLSLRNVEFVFIHCRRPKQNFQVSAKRVCSIDYTIRWGIHTLAAAAATTANDTLRDRE